MLCAGYLPPPIHSSQLAQRLLQQQKYERLDEGGEVQEIEMELEENEPEKEKEATENKEMVRMDRSVEPMVELSSLVCFTSIIMPGIFEE